MIFSGQYGLPGRGRTGSLWSRSPTHYPLCYGQFSEYLFFILPQNQNICKLFYTSESQKFPSFILTFPKIKGILKLNN